MDVLSTYEFPHGSVNKVNSYYSKGGEQKLCLYYLSYSYFKQICLAKIQVALKGVYKDMLRPAILKYTIYKEFV